MLSPMYQTYGCEVFHSVIVHFAPKSTHYSYKGMIGRLLLAALHYNENSDKGQAVTKEGIARWSVAHPKMKKGTVAIAKPIKNKPTYVYAARLMEEVVQRRLEFPSYPVARNEAENLLPEAPPALNSGYEAYEKSVLVKSRKSRFQDQRIRK
ncbi:uncharacterized protein LOC106163756 [Lingula anatina]|uniref:Uncharacterized protein LOC106163756 n=1 Tax=Lingula anatina TaxID=7574 RepID=A0A1S3IF77_LINAN|nr:uncharacterized protein LOC106163756 [Lingula anatina]|eukprot:XP_013396887.2 uncharacterized protein LOC106163756 [Lingula anatina]